MKPTLLAVAHGTRWEPGQAQLRALVDRIARQRPDVDVRLAYADVQAPRVAEAAAALDGPAVVVPLLLSHGYHVRVDIAEGIAGANAVATAPLGPDPALVDILAERITAAGPADAVVLAAAGSSDARSQQDVADVARALPMPAHVGYASGSGPRVSDVVTGLRAAGARRVVVGAYLLADGLFHRVLADAGADAVTDPLITDPRVVDVVLRRYDTAPVLAR